jgi:hypothetical protein
MPAGTRAFAIGEYSGEDDDDPNVATRDRRVPPQELRRNGGGAPLMGGCGVRAVVRHLHSCMVVGRAAELQGCRVVSVLLSS